VAGLVNLDIMEREGLHKVGLVLEGDIAEALEPLVDTDLVTEVRAGLGALAAIQFDTEAVDADPTLPGRAFRAGLDQGVISRILTGWAYQVSPPLVITKEQIGEMASGFATALRSLN
jgi:adenosylmethionine-8-amino-7-oxononanoate aminotransferase